MEVSAKTISKRSLFKLMYQSLGIGLLSFCVLMGVFSIFGFETVAWNGEYITGISGFFVAILLGLFLSIFFTAFMWVLGIFGLWINSYFKGVTIVFKQVKGSNAE